MERVLIPNKPDTAIEQFYGLTNDFILGAGSMRGWRPTMEDSFTIIISLPQDPSTSLFGVFDGHGSRCIADFVSENIYQYIVTDPAFVNGDFVTGIENGFIRLDRYLRRHPVFGRLDAGSTAVVVLIRHNIIYCANLGDSRAVAYVKGEAIPLSTDHKPMLHKERMRIVQAGYFIEEDRINADLAMSRSFGDFRFKQNKRKSLREQAVISVPEITVNTLSKNWEFIVLACDGIWDVMSNEQVCRFVKMRINRNIRPNVICQQLLGACLCKDFPSSDFVGTDNMTAIIVVLLNNSYQPYTGISEYRSSSISYVCKESM